MGTQVRACGGRFVNQREEFSLRTSALRETGEVGQVFTCLHTKTLFQENHRNRNNIRRPNKTARIACGVRTLQREVKSHRQDQAKCSSTPIERRARQRDIHRTFRFLFVSLHSGASAQQRARVQKAELSIHFVLLLFSTLKISAVSAYVIVMMSPRPLLNRRLPSFSHSSRERGSSRFGRSHPADTHDRLILLILMAWTVFPDSRLRLSLSRRFSGKPFYTKFPPSENTSRTERMYAPLSSSHEGGSLLAAYRTS